MIKLRKHLAVVAAGMLTAVVVPATSVASVDAPNGAEPTLQKADAVAVASADAASDAKPVIQKLDSADLKEIGVRLPSACTPSDDEPYRWGFVVNGTNVWHGMSCYEAKGDDQWVKDTLNNDRAFGVKIQTEYDKIRYCTDNTAGWTECKFDHIENECLFFRGWYKNYYTWQSTTPWISTTTGNPGCTGD